MTWMKKLTYVNWQPSAEASTSNYVSGSSFHILSNYNSLTLLTLDAVILSGEHMILGIYEYESCHLFGCDILCIFVVISINTCTYLLPNVFFIFYLFWQKFDKPDFI
jgi:hypothetical protein